ncbi:hypothetical protein N7524_008647 [Penicillium chrysogenum]|nr:hypothetical protein N7524_008647 [Penicillium chrysogenum]
MFWTTGYLIEVSKCQEATNYRSGRSLIPPSASAIDAQRKGLSSSSGLKRPSSDIDAADTEELAELKFGLVGNESHFLKRSIEAFTPYYQSLVQWVNSLRRLVFPMDKPWAREDRELYSKLKQVLGDGKED